MRRGGAWMPKMRREDLAWYKGCGWRRRRQRLACCEAAGRFHAPNSGGGWEQRGQYVVQATGPARVQRQRFRRWPECARGDNGDHIVLQWFEMKWKKEKEKEKLILELSGLGGAGLLCASGGHGGADEVEFGAGEPRGMCRRMQRGSQCEREGRCTRWRGLHCLVRGEREKKILMSVFFLGGTSRDSDGGGEARLPPRG